MKCKLCGFETDEVGEATVHSFECHEKEVEECFDLGELELLSEAQEEISTEEIPPIPEGVEPEEILEEESALTEEELSNIEVIDSSELIKKYEVLKALNTVNLSWEELSDEAKGEVLSLALTGKSKLLDKEKTQRSMIENYYFQRLESLRNPEVTVCSICHRPWKEIRKSLPKEDFQLELECLEISEKLDFPKERLKHIALEHKLEWNLLKSLRGKTVEFKAESKSEKKPSKEQLSELQEKAEKGEKLTEADIVLRSLMESKRSPN